MSARTSLGLLLFCMLASAGRPQARQDKDKTEPEYAPFKNYVPTDKVLEQHLDMVKKQPRNAVTHSMLGFVYLRKARETGNFSFHDRADECFKRGLQLQPREPRCLIGTALVHSARHQFAEALKLAQELLRKHPDELSLLTLVADVQLELGQEDKAEQTYKDIEKRDPLAPLHSRWARLAELKGQTDEAVKQMREAIDVEAPDALTPEGRSWYPFRLGEIYFNAGNYKQAAKYLEEARTLNPSYPLTLAFLGKVRAAEGKLDEAIRLHVQAVANSAELYLLGDLGDLYLRAGKVFLAKLNHDKVVEAGKKQDVYARELSQFYSNHDRNLPEALELARKDMTVRQDVYAYDTLAWALCKNKQYKEAAEAMTTALRLGTQDASFFYHAGMIYVGLGEKERARAYLERALKLNPHFSVLQAEKAREALKGLK